MFAELLARSCFSFLRGAAHPEEYVDAARRLGLHTLGLCDWGGIYGAVRGHREHRDGSSSSSLRYAIGSELTLEDAGDPEASGTLALLVRNGRGYENLCRILTLGHEGRKKGEFSVRLASLAERSEGLFALWVAPERLSVRANRREEERIGELLRDFFPGNAALVMYRYRDGEDAARLRWTLRARERFGLPVLASARPRYHTPERKALYDVVECIREGTTLEAAGERLDPNAERFLRSESEMRALFADHPEWIDETVRVAETLEFSFSELRYHFPCALEAGESADEKLARLVRESAKNVYAGRVPPRVSEQLDKELALIAKIEVSRYFLSILEIVEIAREKEILCQGRGSAANSAVCFVLGITAVDPAESNLLFERFLSEERAEPPDIDVDFEHERREEVIQAIYERHGRERAAMVSEVISYRGKSAVREVGKVFGLSLEQVDRLAGLHGHFSGGELLDERLVEVGIDPRDARTRLVLALSRQLEGFPRHLSIHVGGFVLSSHPLFEVAPIEPAAMPGRTVLPWDKDDIDTLGFFKVDVLGLGMLTALRKTLALVFESGGLSSDHYEAFSPQDLLRRIPRKDPSTFTRIARADTVGVFQIESRAQMSMLPRLRPSCFYDLVIEVAIVRPGPIQGGMVHPYLRRRNGEEPITYPHPRLKRILERTLGVPLFQEQVMQIAIEGAGYTGGEADQLRRDMGAWKKHGRLLRHEGRLLEGFRKRGIADDFSRALFEQIQGFGEYGFPESHAASFAILVYASAWLKTHYPAHFVCGLLNAQPMGFYPPSTLVKDAQKHGVSVREPCVLESDWDCRLVPDEESRLESGAPGAKRGLLLGLRIVRGIGEESARRFVAQRARLFALGETFRSVQDFAAKSGFSKAEFRALASAGALARLGKSRRESLFLGEAPKVGGLFVDAPLVESQVELAPETKAEQLVLDYEFKGLSIDDHPLRYYRKRLQKSGVTRALDLLYLPRGARVKVAGLVMNRQRPLTAKGTVFMTLEDETGTVNLIVHGEVFDAFRAIALHSPLLLAYGEVERDRAIPPLAPGTREEEGPKATIHVVVRALERLSKDSFGGKAREGRSSRDSSKARESLERLSRNFH